MPGPTKPNLNKRVKNPSESKFLVMRNARNDVSKRIKFENKRNNDKLKTQKGIVRMGVSRPTRDLFTNVMFKDVEYDWPTGKNTRPKSKTAVKVWNRYKNNAKSKMYMQEAAKRRVAKK